MSTEAWTLPDNSGAGVRVGIIGLGRMGALHAAAYASAGANVIAGVDPSPDVRETFERTTGAKAYSTSLEMMEREEIDAVSVCSPPAFHLADVQVAVDHRLHILCEKPLARNLAESKAVRDLADRSGCIFMVAFFNRFFEPVERIIRDAQAPTSNFGPVLGVHIRFNLGQQSPRPWQYDSAVAGGGAILNNLVHGIDLFRILLGEPTSGVAFTRRDRRRNSELESDAFALLRSSNDGIGTFETYSTSPQRSFKMRVETQTATLTASWNPPGLRIEWSDGRDERLPMSSTDPLARIDAGVSRFVDAVAVGTGRGLPDQRDAHRAVEVADGLYRSVNLGSVIDLSAP